MEAEKTLLIEDSEDETKNQKVAWTLYNRLKFRITEYEAQVIEMEGLIWHGDKAFSLVLEGK